MAARDGLPPFPGRLVYLIIPNLETPRNKVPMKTLNRLKRAIRNTNPGDLPLEKLSLYIDKLQRVFNRLHNDLQETYFPSQ